MISRKKFLGLTALGALGVSKMASASNKSETFINIQDGDLPPSIAALKSMKDRVRPITVEERKRRIKRAKELMGESDIDAIVVMGGSTLEYFVGLRWWISERMLALVIPQKKDPFIVCPFFEKSRAMEQLKNGPLADLDTILTWKEHENPYEQVVKGLKERELGKGKIGIEEDVRFVFSHGIKKASAGKSKLVSATPVTAGCRGVKSEGELELMRLASEATFKAYEAAYKAAEVGMTQDEFGQLIALAHEKLGFKGYASVQVGKWAALPHGSQTPQKIMENQVVMIDGGCQVEGYWSDLTRTFVLGEPGEKEKEVFKIVLEAQTAGINAARPGVEAQTIDAAARQVIIDAGYGPDYKYFTHRLGHGIGLDMHEWPYLVKGNKTILKPGHTFSDEPGIYIPDEFGIRTEDDIVITSEGAAFLSPQALSLTAPFNVKRPIDWK